MKRIVAFFLFLVLLTTSFSITSAEAEKSITFRGLKWYTTKKKAEKQLFKEGASIHGWLGSPNDIYRLEAIDYENVTLGSERVDGGGVREWYADVSVAGFDVEDTYACYVYPIKDGKIVRDDDKAQFYFGWYSFGRGDYSDHEGIFKDLKKKLTKLYGKGKTKKSYYHTTVTWKDKKKNTIQLLINDDKDYVSLGYIAGSAKKRLDAMQKALDEEAKEKERQKRKKNKKNNQGL